MNETIDDGDGSEWRITRLRPDFQVRVARSRPELPPAVEARVAALWAQELRQRPRLFNGTVFSVDTTAPGHVEGHWTEYRRALAQMRAPDLFARLGIRALAVNGLLECADGIVLGRRDPAAVYRPSRWHGPPAGSVEQRPESGSGIDLAAQLLDECREELGIAVADVVASRPVLAIEHPGSHVVDIGMLLRTALDFARIEAAWSGNGNREYDRLRLLSRESARDDAALRPLDLLPPTLALLEAWRRD